MEIAILMVMIWYVFSLSTVSYLASAFCQNVTCPVGQECRIVNTCDGDNTCQLSERCVDENTYPSGCIYGMPMLVMTQGLSRLEYDLEECFTGKDCHEGFICTDGYIQDVVGRCCHAKPFVDVPGFCPAVLDASDPNSELCVTQCLSDGDCGRARKCCYTSTTCEKGKCENRLTVHPLTMNTRSAPLMQSVMHRPCTTSMDCIASEECRIMELCFYGTAFCDVNGHCIPVTISSQLRRGCGDNLPVLAMSNGAIDVRSCSEQHPCTGNSFCNTQIQGTFSRCCISNVDMPQISAGTCPPPSPYSSQLCSFDQCSTDDNCRPGKKCCQTSLISACKVCKSAIYHANDPCHRMYCPVGSTCINNEYSQAECVRSPQPLIQNETVSDDAINNQRCPKMLQFCSFSKSCNGRSRNSCGDGYACCPTMLCGRRCFRSRDRYGPEIQPKRGFRYPFPFKFWF